jgi:metalloendopeptidase OMA1, mitochondrial
MKKRNPIPVLVVAVALLGTGCATKQFDPVSGRQVRNMYTLQEDIQLGRGVLNDAVKTMREEGVGINQDLRMLATLTNMMLRIAAVSHYPDLPYEVTLFHTNIVNAAAAPGGQLLFFEGLYHPKTGLVRGDDELAAVMAHEIAHVTARHTTKNITKAMPVNMLLLVGALAAEMTENEDLALAFGAAFVVYHGLILPKYSRADEHEADILGMFYMAKAGFDPRAAPRVWKRVHDREGSSGLMKYISSHPAHKDRYRTLDRHLQEAIAIYEISRVSTP